MIREAARAKARTRVAVTVGAVAPAARTLVRPVNLLFWVLLLGFALVLRLVGADSLGIWQDEGLTLYQVRLPFEEILANRIPVAHFITRNTVPPLYFLLLSVWGHLVGYGLWALRIFSIFSVLLVSVLLYRVGSWVDEPRTGRIAALLGAISPLYLWYGQELRMYAFLLIPATLSLGLLWRAWERWKEGAQAWPFLAAYACTAALMVWTHYLAFLLVAAQMLWLALLLLRRKPALLLATGGALLLLALPLIPYGISRLVQGAERDFFFMPLSTITNDLLHALAFGLPYFMSRVEEVRFLFPLVWLLLGMGAWQAWRKGGGALLALLGLAFLLPIALLYVLSYIKPLYQNARHLIVVSPAFYLLWALGVNRLAQIRRGLPLLVILPLAYGWGLSIDRYFTTDEPLKNDVRPLFESIAARYVPGDVVALNDPVLQHALEYFAPGVPWVVLPPYGEPVTDERAIPAYEAVAEQYDRMWYVYGPPDTTFDTWEHVYEWFTDHYPRVGYVEFPGQSIVAAAYFDLQGPVIQDGPYALARPLNERFAETIQLRGLHKALAPVAAGQHAVVETVWTVDEQPLHDYQIVLQVKDQQGQLWYQQQFLPLDGLHVTSRWIPGQHVRVPLFLEPPVTLPPGQYDLGLHLVAPDGSAVFAERDGNTFSLGTLAITRAVSEASLDGVQFGEALHVAGGGIAGTVPPGDALSFRLVVKVEELVEALPDSLDVLLAEPDGTVVWSQEVPLEAGLPAGADGAPLFPLSEWEEGDLFELRYHIVPPPELSGHYTVSLRLKRDGVPVETSRLWGLRREEALQLGMVTVEAREPRLEAPELDEEVDVSWSGAVVELLGYRVEPVPATPQAPLHLQLVWRAGAATEKPYKVFVHAVNEQGVFVTGADAFFDVSSVIWQEGEIVTSDHLFGPGVLPPGRYTILTGLYDEATLARASVDAPDNAVPIGTITVEQP